MTARNEYKPGRVLHTCPLCSRQLWVQADILERAYQGGEKPCLDCRAGIDSRKRENERRLAQATKDLSIFGFSVNGRGFNAENRLFLVSTYQIPVPGNGIAIAELQARGWVIFNRTQLPGRGEYVQLKKEWKV